MDKSQKFQSQALNPELVWIQQLIKNKCKAEIKLNVNITIAWS